MTGPRAGTRAAVTVALAVALVAAILASIVFGARGVILPLDPALLADPGSSPEGIVLWEQRLPRTAAGLVTGVALGLAGVAAQAITRNRLADPGLLGVAPGAAFAVTVAVAWADIVSLRAQLWIGMAGAATVTVAVYLLGRRATPTRIVLAGVALGSVFAGLSAAIALRDPEAFDRMRRWGAGALGGRTMTDLADFLPFGAAGVVLCFLLARKFDVLALGDDIAVQLGLRIALVRGLAAVSIALMVGSATALVGPVSFVGLIVPLLLRPMARGSQSRLMTLTALGAPALVLASDVVGRVLPTPGELPVGVVTALLGGGLLAACATGGRARALT